MQIVNNNNNKFIRYRGGSRGRVEGVVTPPPPLGSFQSCLATRISSSPIDHYKKTGVIHLLDSLIIQMHDRFSDEDRHACHLLCLVPSIIVNKELQLDWMK